MIEINGLWKHYDRVTAVAGVSLRVDRARMLGIIGPNGSGKTTLLRMISTLVKPSAGSLSVCGIDALAAPREVRRRISLMPAEASAPLDMSIGEYMQYFACAAGVPRSDRLRAVNEALELTDMAGRDDVIIRGLSTGNRQRLLLAKTLLGDPDVLLLDEPASGLDPRARLEVRGYLRALASMGKTIVISSHILADLEDICTDICILEEGKQQLSGTLEDLRRHAAEAHKRIHLTVAAAEMERAHDLLASLPDVLECEIAEGAIEAVCRLENCNPILRVMLDAEIEILSFREAQLDLEDIFMESTRGVVS